MIKNLFKTVFMITIFTALSRFIGFLIRVFLGRTIGANGLGVFQMAQSIFLVLITFIISGIPLSISRIVSKDTKDKNKIGSLIYSGLKVGLITSIIFTIIIFIFKTPIQNIFKNKDAFNIFLYLIPSIFFHAIKTPFDAFLWGKEKHFTNCLIDFIEQVIRFILSILLIGASKDFIVGAKYASIALTMSSFISALMSFCYFKKYGGNIYFNNTYTKQLLKESSPITIVRVMSSISQPLISILLPIQLINSGFTHNQAFSLLGVSTGMMLPILFVPSSIIGSLATALIPNISGLLATNNIDELKRKIKNSISFSFFISTLFVPFFFGAGRGVGDFLFKNQLCGEMLSKSAFLLIPIGLSQISTSILNALGLERKSLKSYVYSVIALIVSILFFPQFISIYALTLSMFISMSINTICNLQVIQRELKTKVIPIKEILIICLVTLPLSFLCNFIFNITKNFLGLFFALATSGIITAIFYTLVCYALGIINFKTLGINKPIIFLKMKKK